MIDWTKSIETNEKNPRPCVLHLPLLEDSTHSRIVSFRTCVGSTAIRKVNCYGEQQGGMPCIRNVPERITGWMNVYASQLYETKKRADARHPDRIPRVACIEIDVTEGEGLEVDHG